MENNLTLYKLYSPKMKTGDMLEFASDTALGKTIRFFTGRYVNHTALLLNLDGYKKNGARRYLLEALENGVEPNILSERLENFKGRVYWSALNDIHDDKRLDMAAWAMSMVGTKYDYYNVVFRFFERGVVDFDASKLFCSELYQGALARVKLISKTLKTVPPGGFKKFMLHKDPVRIV